MKVRFEPSGVTMDAPAGQTVLEAALQGGVEIAALCGGRGTCGKCKIIASQGLSPLNAQEQKALGVSELAAHYRLACQAVIVSDTHIVVPDESRSSRVSILSEGSGAEGVALDPWVHRYTLRVPKATLEDQLPDTENVARVLQDQYGVVFRPTLDALRQLPLALRADDGQITLLQVDDRVVRICAGAGPKRLLGIAFDLGTTTVVGYLLDLESGEQLAVSSLLNPQTRYGDDVVSRIAFASTTDGLRTLQQDIVGALNQIITQTTTQAAVPIEDILAMTVVGNTTMQHLLLQISPTALAQSPYIPAFSRATSVSAGTLGLVLNAQATVWVFPNIAGWVGGDTVGVILSTRIYEQDEIALAIDIGTNGEMALGSKERLITCSAAAGPAFEGAHLSCGMRAADGAIDMVNINETIDWHTIGESAPRGICGSGLVDLVAEMLRAEIINPTGMMQDAQTLALAGRERYAQAVLQEGRLRRFRLVDPAQGAGGRPVDVTQRDIRELQLAKGAIRAGIEIMMKELGITNHDVHCVYLAGAFGNYIKPENALGIGLIPELPNAEIVPVGNAAGSGAKMALLSLAEREKATSILARVEYLELSGRPDFQEEFAEAMLFA